MKKFIAYIILSPILLPLLFITIIVIPVNIFSWALNTAVNIPKEERYYFWPIFEILESWD